jgi:ankyrin repeat protein
MKQKFSTFFLILVLGFLFVSNAKAGEREDNLVTLAVSGDVNGVRALLDQGVDINAKRHGTGFTALCAAIMFNDSTHAQDYINIVKLFLARGADINQVCSGGSTLLTASLSSGSADIVRVLIDKGADVNKKDENGYTALMSANRMLEKGHVVGFDDSLNATYRPLTSAERETYTKIVRMLKTAGAK